MVDGLDHGSSLGRRWGLVNRQEHFKRREYEGGNPRQEVNGKNLLAKTRLLLLMSCTDDTSF